MEIPLKRRQQQRIALHVPDFQAVAPRQRVRWRQHGRQVPGRGAPSGSAKASSGL